MMNWGFLIAVVSLIVIVSGENNDVRPLSKNNCKEILMDQIRRECGAVYTPTREALSRHNVMPLSTLFQAGEAGDIPDLLSSWTFMEDDQQSQQLSERVKRMADQFQVWGQCCRTGQTCKMPSLCSDDSEY